MVCIYSIISKISGNQYVGSTTCFRKRESQHRCDLRHNRHHSLLMQRAYNKYGFDNLIWGVLEELPANATKEEIENAEEKWITALKPKYNASLSVKRHMLGRKLKPLSEETKAKIRAKVTGYKHTTEAKEKMSKWQTGRKRVLTPENKERLHQNGLRRGAMGQTDATKEKIRKIKTGVVKSEETKHKHSMSLINKPWTQKRIDADLDRKKEEINKNCILITTYARLAGVTHKVIASRIKDGIIKTFMHNSTGKLRLHIDTTLYPISIFLSTYKKRKKT